RSPAVSRSLRRAASFTSCAPSWACGTGRPCPSSRARIRSTFAWVGCSTACGHASDQSPRWPDRSDPSARVSSMKYLEVLERESGYVAKLEETEDPRPGAGELLLRVAASGVNRADLSQIAGKYPPPPGESEILGLEADGTI